MGVLVALVTPFRVFNDWVLALGRSLAMVALAIMVCFILAQVFFRYVLNDALPWPDEGARFMMLWMTGLIAPTAFRRGGFVAIDLTERALPIAVARVLVLLLLLISTLVIVYCLRIGFDEVTGFAGTFKTASLYNVIFPSFGDMSVEVGLNKMPRSHMMASLVVGMALMLVVAVELILRQVIAICGGGDRLPPLIEADVGMGE